MERLRCVKFPAVSAVKPIINATLSVKAFFFTTACYSQASHPDFDNIHRNENDFPVQQATLPVQRPIKRPRSRRLI